MNGLEIIISPDALSGLTNYDELMAYAKESIQPYESMVVTEEELSTAKDVVARMRKVGKAASDLRIRTEKEHAAKIALTVKQLKEITQTFTDAATKIDTQVKAIVNERKKAKRDELEAYFQEVAGNAGAYIAFADIEDEKWQNAGVSIDTAKEQIAEAMRSFNQDVAALESLKAEPAVKAACKAEFMRTKSLAAAIRLQGQLEQAAEEQRAKEAEAARIAEERRKAEQAAAPQETPKPETPISAPEALTQTPIPAHTEENKVRLVFWVEGTAEQFKGLKQFLLDNGMRYGKA